MEAVAIFMPIFAGLTVFMLALMLASGIVSFFALLFDTDQYEEMAESW